MPTPRPNMRGSPPIGYDWNVEVPRVLKIPDPLAQLDCRLTSYTMTSHPDTHVCTREGAAARSPLLDEGRSEDDAEL